MKGDHTGSTLLSTRRVEDSSDLSSEGRSDWMGVTFLSLGRVALSQPGTDWHPLGTVAGKGTLYMDSFHVTSHHTALINVFTLVFRMCVFEHKLYFAIFKGVKGVISSLFTSLE